MKNFNFRFVCKTLGFLLIIESLFMMLSTIVSFYCRESCGDVMLACSTVPLLCGMFLRLFGFQEYEEPIGKRESFFAVTMSWIVLSAFGMLPYYFSGVIPDIHNAFFETMAGFTTTGASIIENIDSVPKGLHFWRSLTQWIGGIGIIVFALILLPVVGGNASVLYDAEVTGIVHERFRPRVTQVAKRVWATYCGISILLFVLLYIGPMSAFDSICHAMSTISTGGYSTKQASIAYWNSRYVEYVITFFMFIGGVNFALIYFLIKGRGHKLFKDEEFRWYFTICLVFTLVVGSSLYFSGTITEIEPAFRTSVFQVVSIITTTGFITADYMEWGAFYSFLFCLLMLFCACAGSTSGGIKIVRIVVLCKNAITEFKRQVHPNAILPVRINGHVVPIDVVTKVLAFMFLYLVILIISFLFLSFMGLTFEESVGAAVSCMGNVGPGLGTLGPTGHFADIPVVCKWFLSFLMLTGRLELFTVLSLFMPAFWKR